MSTTAATLTADELNVLLELAQARRKAMTGARLGHRRERLNSAIAKLFALLDEQLKPAAPVVDVPEAATSEAPPLRAARLDVDELRTRVVANGQRLEVGWRWVGRERHGMLQVYDGNECVYGVEFARATQLWSQSDASLARVRSGSPKHLAIVEVLTYLRRAYP